MVDVMVSAIEVWNCIFNLFLPYPIQAFFSLFLLTFVILTIERIVSRWSA